MEKLDDLAKEKESEHQVFDTSANTSIACGCCNELPTVQPVTTRKEGEENKSEDNNFGDEEHGHSRQPKEEAVARGMER